MTKRCAGQMLFLLFACSTVFTNAQNPIIRNQFSADPSARVFAGRVYLYPSHDILATEGKGRIGWFCMEDYHVFSSANLTDWTDHGIIITQNKVPWVKPNSFSMWAPDCIERNGKFYFYFPTSPADTLAYGRGFRIGVAISDKPTGPFIPLPEPIKEVRGIDPNVFIDKDGQAYLYWSAGNIYGAKLKSNMTELESPVNILENLPSKGLKEGPYLFERNGIYYLTYPHVENKIERLEYAVGDNPLGPFKFTGVIMDESPTGCWTNHHSIIQFNNQWYLFYHHNDYSTAFDKARSVRADSLFFNADGKIRKVIPTLRGIGIIPASNQIEIDRYSQISDSGASIGYVDTMAHFQGWKTTFTTKGAWVKFNAVDFGKTKFKRVIIRVMSEAGGTFQIRLGNSQGPVIAEIKIPVTKGWQLKSAAVQGVQNGIQNLVVVSTAGGMAEVDWVRFQ